MSYTCTTKIQLTRQEDVPFPNQPSPVANLLEEKWPSSGFEDKAAWRQEVILFGSCSLDCYDVLAYII